MMIRTFACAALLGLALELGAAPARADAADYAFEPVSAEVKSGAGSELAVRLVHKQSGKPVSGAVLFRTRLDMSPDKMEAMTANHAPIPSSEAGVYRFKADLTMAGGWALKIMAKVPGETETVQGTVVFKTSR